MDNITTILKIFSNHIMSSPQALYENPISNLISKFRPNEVKFLKNVNNLNLYHLIRDNLCKLLYDHNEIITIKDKDFIISDFAQLAMLIDENENLINFSYNISLININKEKYNKLQKIFLSKIILKLIHNYRGLNICTEEDEDQLKKIEKENKSFIEQNINKYIDIGLDNNTVKIEDLYCNIIYKVLKGNAGNFEYVKEIFESLNLASINITNKMYEKLLELFDDDFIKEYQIINENDFKNEQKINFYYVLFYYILKNPFYIYQIPFLIKTQKLLRKLIKNNLIKKEFFDLDHSLYDKIKYIMKVLLNSDYYFKKLDNYLRAEENTEQLNITENNNNNELNSILENEIESDIYETNTTHIKLTNRNNNHKNQRKNNFEELEVTKNTEIKYNTNIMNQFESEKNNSCINHAVLTDKNKDTSDDGNIKCEKIINETKHLLGNGNYYLSDNLPERDNIENEIFIKNNKLNINVNGYQIEVYTYNNFLDNVSKLIFFDKKNNCILKEIDGYSFLSSVKRIAIMHKKILICPCKQNSSEHKKGILSIYFNFKQNEYLTFFHEIKDFKANCICTLFNPQKKQTNFILVGGKGKDVSLDPSIKLYKINYYIRSKRLKIQFLRDILIIENALFTIPKKPINYIKQSKVNGKIQIWSDKSIYLCSPLNLSNYLYFEELERLELFYDIYNYFRRV